MGMMFADVTFNGTVPALTAICEKITEITTLAVVVLQKEQNDLHELNARIAFQCSLETDLKLLAYRPGAVRRFCEESFDEPSHSSFMQRIVQGANEPAGSQTVYLRGYIVQEPTLMAVTELALDALGGSREIQSPTQIDVRTTEQSLPTILPSAIGISQCRCDVRCGLPL